jgi:histone deacetylase complex regulatory component SIN3
MGYFEYVINIYKSFMTTIKELQSEAVDTLNKYGGF